MHVRTRTLGALAGAAALLALAGCTVSRSQYLNTAFGPGKSPETYRVGGLAPQTNTEAKVVVVRSADLEVAGAPSSAAAQTPAAINSPGAPPASPIAPMPVPQAPSAAAEPLGGMALPTSPR